MLMRLSANKTTETEAFAPSIKQTTIHKDIAMKGTSTKNAYPHDLWNPNTASNANTTPKNLTTEEASIKKAICIHYKAVLA